MSDEKKEYDDKNEASKSMIGNDFALKYTPECDKLIYEHMRNGHTVSCFNITPPVAQKTIFAWLKDHPSFLLAKETGEAEFQKLVEKCAYSKVTGLKIPALEKMGSKKIDGEMVRFVLSRRFRNEYAEKKEVEHKGEPVTKVVVEVVGGSKD